MKKNFGERKKSYKKSKKRQFVYSFNLMDIKTRMYIGCGTSFKSEKDAFYKASEMIKKTGIKINTLRLDKYYSNKGDVISCQKLFGKAKMYLIPKTNATIGGFEWNKMLGMFIEDVKGYLKEYYKRNQSESGFSEDKRRIGQMLGQKRDDRIDTANFLTTIWHNLYWLG
jgi:transposase